MGCAPRREQTCCVGSYSNPLRKLVLPCSVVSDHVHAPVHVVMCMYMYMCTCVHSCLCVYMYTSQSTANNAHVFFIVLLISVRCFRAHLYTCTCMCACLREQNRLVLNFTIESDA